MLSLRQNRMGGIPWEFKGLSDIRRRTGLLNLMKLPREGDFTLQDVREIEGAQGRMSWVWGGVGKEKRECRWGGSLGR